MFFCIHHNDLDGRCSAAIVKYFHHSENIQFIEMDYKDELDITPIFVNSKIVIVDFSLKPEIMEKLLTMTTNITWIDPHKTADEYKYSVELKGLRNTKYKKYAACELTWDYYSNLYHSHRYCIPSTVCYIGDRDKWAWEYGKETAWFNEGIKLYNTNPDNCELWDRLFNDDTEIDEAYKITEDGKKLITYRDNICANYVKSYGWETMFEGCKCFCLGILQFGSEAFGDKFDKYSICIAYEYLGDKWTVSLYSKTVDVSVIAKKYDGGGHVGAAGFVCDALPFSKLT